MNSYLGLGMHKNRVFGEIVVILEDELNDTEEGQREILRAGTVEAGSGACAKNTEGRARALRSHPISAYRSTPCLTWA